MEHVILAGQDDTENVRLSPSASESQPLASITLAVSSFVLYGVPEIVMVGAVLAPGGSTVQPMSFNRYKANPRDSRYSVYCGSINSLGDASVLKWLTLEPLSTGFGAYISTLSSASNSTEEPVPELLKPSVNNPTACVFTLVPAQSKPVPLIADAAR